MTFFYNKIGHSSYGLSFKHHFARNIYWSPDFLREDVTRSSRSPDLSPRDFFLWKYLKSEYFKHPPEPFNNKLKKTIRQEITTIPIVMLE